MAKRTSGGVPVADADEQPGGVHSPVAGESNTRAVRHPTAAGTGAAKPPAPAHEAAPGASNARAVRSATVNPAEDGSSGEPAVARAGESASAAPPAPARPKRVVAPRPKAGPRPKPAPPPKAPRKRTLGKHRK